MSEIEPPLGDTDRDLQVAWAKGFIGLAPHQCRNGQARSGACLPPVFKGLC